MYTAQMDIAITELRAHLGEWLDHARNGEEVIVTDRGVPVAKLTGIGATDAIERLTADGVISRPTTDRRPKATGRRRVRAHGPVADLVTEQRD